MLSRRPILPWLTSTRRQRIVAPTFSYIIIPVTEVQIQHIMEIERNLGRQPIADVMEKLELKPHDLVAASPEQLTHKMVQRAAKGRRLTDNTKSKVVAALEAATQQKFSNDQLFTY